MADPVYVSAAVEGTIDDAVARRLIKHAGAMVASIYGRSGKTRLLQHAHGYNEAAKLGPWFVLVDLNGDESCAPLARRRWLESPVERMCFRVVVREIEAWLMADREALANFLSVPPSAFPLNPEAVDHPKELLVTIASRSRRRAVRADMVPREGSGRATGEAYEALLSEFVESRWDPVAASASSDSVRRAIECLKRLTRPAT